MAAYQPFTLSNVTFKYPSISFDAQGSGRIAYDIWNCYDSTGDHFLATEYQDIDSAGQYTYTFTSTPDLRRYFWVIALDGDDTVYTSPRQYAGVDSIYDFGDSLPPIDVGFSLDPKFGDAPLTVLIIPYAFDYHQLENLTLTYYDFEGDGIFDTTKDSTYGTHWEIQHTYNVSDTFYPTIVFYNRWGHKYARYGDPGLIIK